MSKSKPLTVKELIKALSQLPPDREVWSEGYDCWGEVIAAKLIDDGWPGHCVLLARSHD